MDSQENTPSELHVVLIPSAGMGHLNPFSRLAATLADHCKVTMVSNIPAVSSAESHHLADMFSAYPQIDFLQFEMPAYDSSDYPDADPFILRWEMISRSAPDIHNYVMKSSSVPVTAFVVDIPIAASFIPLAKNLGIPCYIMFISTAAMLSFGAYFPTYCDTKTTVDLGDVEIPGYRTVPLASIPGALHDPKNLFTKQFVQNGRVLLKVDGIFVNTFQSFEEDSLAALRDGRVQPGFPPVITVGPLMPLNMPASGASEVFPWLDKQPDNSVLYVNFGNRTGMSREQVRELGLGLETSGCRFLWVVKTKALDSQDIEDLGEILEKGYLERVKDRGIVMKGWVEQDKVLRHKAVGGFLSHSGSNSVIEAAMYGVRMLAWPMGGDQRINAVPVVKSGLGMWPKSWSWQGEDKIVSGKEIGEKVKEMMADEALFAKARLIGEEARKAAAPGGTSYQGLVEFVQKLKDRVK
ncbi:Glycosyltransferase [Rhynchospora pubera]|uniref:Glycosyltransferase n=1 Tax=Rhynchospora pubera TaxID=906938 RepID=A0AAV8HIZ7_9POAL|nr:Glycosyltransferase [Rhynchospora pubera]